MYASIHGKILERIYSKMLIVVMVGGKIICDIFALEPFYNVI